ncbi:hypothetical protein Sjap_002291 [Stephania japonica]|uniref:Peptide chain release factor domain-containing protein n=1 Tax=Stephania japonica TaxID=461633 RepID=A0AAP0PVZ4_9MAGN
MASTSEMVLCVFVDGAVAALLCGNGGAEKANNSLNSSDGGAEKHVESSKNSLMGERFHAFSIPSINQANPRPTRRMVKLVDPNVVSNPNEYQNLAKSMAEHNEVISTYREFKDCEKQLEETKDLSKESGGDEDMA